MAWTQPNYKNLSFLLWEAMHLDPYTFGIKNLYFWGSIHSNVSNNFRIMSCHLELQINVNASCLSSHYLIFQNVMYSATDRSYNWRVCIWKIFHYWVPAIYIFRNKFQRQQILKLPKHLLLCTIRRCKERIQVVFRFQSLF